MIIETKYPNYKIFIKETFTVDYHNQIIIYFKPNNQPVFKSIFESYVPTNEYYLNSKYHYDGNNYWKSYHKQAFCCSGLMENNRMLIIYKKHIDLIDDNIELKNEIENYFFINKDLK